MRSRTKNIEPPERGLEEVEGEDSGQQILKIGKESYIVSTPWMENKVAMGSHLNQLILSLELLRELPVTV